MLEIKNNFRFLHCILAYLVSFYSSSRGGSFGVDDLPFDLCVTHVMHNPV